jgi:hypothetical protein
MTMRASKTAVVDHVRGSVVVEIRVAPGQNPPQHAAWMRLWAILLAAECGSPAAAEAQGEVLDATIGS